MGRCGGAGRRIFEGGARCPAPINRDLGLMRAGHPSRGDEHLCGACCTWLR